VAFRLLHNSFIKDKRLLCLLL